MMKRKYVKPVTDTQKKSNGAEFEFCVNISQMSGNGIDLSKKRKEEQDDLEEERLELIISENENISLW